MPVPQHLCYNCFKERQTPEGPCPYCGYDHAAHAAKYPMALRAGSILNGQYIVGRVLGQGGFGITYLAFDYQLKIKVAIKEYMPDGMATRLPETTLVSVYTGEKQENFTYGAERFLDEARVLAKFLGNKNIAGVKSYFNENNTSYFVMDYIEGVSFKTYIQNQGGKINYTDALRVLVPVLRALSVVHREGFIHRDVTPDNIYITKDGEIKLLDFGSARYSLGDKSKSLDVILKAGYAPKEQYMRRGKQGPYTDVYSVAACFYAAITGYLPPEALERMEEDELVAPSLRGVKLPTYLENAILKGLEVKAEDRYQSAEELLAAIEQGQLNEAGAIAAPAMLPVLPQPPSQAAVTGGISQNIAAATQQSATPQPPIAQQAVRNDTQTSQASNTQQQPQWSMPAPSYAEPVPASPVYSAPQSPQFQPNNDIPIIKKKSLKSVYIALGAFAACLVLILAITQIGTLARRNRSKPALYENSASPTSAPTEATPIPAVPETKLVFYASTSYQYMADMLTQACSETGVALETNFSDYSSVLATMQSAAASGTSFIAFDDGTLDLADLFKGTSFSETSEASIAPFRMIAVNTDGDLSSKIYHSLVGQLKESKEFVFNREIVRYLAYGPYGCDLNGSRLTSQNSVDEYKYYIDTSDEFKIFRKPETGGTSEPITDCKSAFLTYYDGWIYYSNLNDGGSLYKVQTDGTQNTKLKDGSCKRIRVADGWVYFLSSDQNVCKIRIDGSDETTLLSDALWPGAIAILDGEIFVATMDGIYMSSVENEIFTNIWPDGATGITRHADQIYFINAKDSTLWRMDPDGSNVTKLCDNSCMNIISVSSGIYFRDTSDYELYLLADNSNVPQKVE